MFLTDWNRRVCWIVVLGSIALLSFPSTYARPTFGLTQSLQPQSTAIRNPYHQVGKNGWLRQRTPIYEDDEDMDDEDEDLDDEGIDDVDEERVVHWMKDVESESFFAFGTSAYNEDEEEYAIQYQEGILVIDRSSILGGKKSGKTKLFKSKRCLFGESDIPNSDCTLTSDTSGLTCDDTVVTKVTPGWDVYDGGNELQMLLQESAYGEGSKYIACIFDSLLQPED